MGITIQLCILKGRSCRNRLFRKKTHILYSSNEYVEWSEWQESPKIDVLFFDGEDKCPDKIAAALKNVSNFFSDTTYLYS